MEALLSELNEDKGILENYLRQLDEFNVELEQKKLDPIKPLTRKEFEQQESGPSTLIGWPLVLEDVCNQHERSFLALGVAGMVDLKESCRLAPQE